MAVPDLYGTVLTFLKGDGGDVRTAINAEFSSLIPTGSVVVSRGARGKAARREKPPSYTVEIVPQNPPAPRAVGIGVVEQDVVVDLEFTARKKDKVEGDSQIDVVEDVARTLVYRYEGKSTFSITPTGATFRRSQADVVEIDSIPESQERSRSIVRVAFTFSYTTGDNA